MNPNHCVQKCALLRTQLVNSFTAENWVRSLAPVTTAAVQSGLSDSTENKGDFFWEGGLSILDAIASALVQNGVKVDILYCWVLYSVRL